MKDLALHRYGVDLELCPERAVYRPDRREVLVADVHIGKAAAFRAAGRPLPMGTTRSELQRLDAVVQRKRAVRLTILGDLFHGELDPNGSTAVLVRQWLTSHASLEVTLIAGNHDRHAEPLIDSLPLRAVPEPYSAAPFAYRHFEAPSGPFLAGHVHPGIHLRGGADSLKLPVFWLKPQGLLLPAFGRFTGLHLIQPSPHDSLAAVTDTAVIEVPAH